MADVRFLCIYLVYDFAAIVDLILSLKYAHACLYIFGTSYFLMMPVNAHFRPSFVAFASLFSHAETGRMRNACVHLIRRNYILHTLVCWYVCECVSRYLQLRVFVVLLLWYSQIVKI